MEKDACDRNDSKRKVFELLQEVSGSTQSNDFTQPLCRAAVYGRDDIAALLLAQGENPDQANARGRTALYLAAWNNNLKVAKLLIAYRADVNLPNQNGLTPLHGAVFSGHPEMARMLIEAGALVGQTYKNGDTLLHVAARNNRTEICKALLEAKARVDLVNERGRTALFEAVRRGYTEVAELLLKKRADPNAGEECMLDLMVEKANEEMINLLLSYGANCSAYKIRTPLHDPAQKGDLKFAKAMLKRGAYLDAQDGDGNTPLLLAVESGCPEIVELLLSLGADPQVANNHGDSPVSYVEGQQGPRKTLEG